MNYTTNFNLRLPERNEQFNLDDWNNNTTSIDSAMQTNKTNISNNATNITSILNGLSTVNISDTSSIYYKLMKLIYPVGSLYWSSKSTNPGTLFGGTWVQIKDRFVLACGDTYKTVGATGGASTVTLSVSNMPSHSHSFSPSGEVTSTFTGTAVNTGGMSANSTGTLNAYHHNRNPILWGSVSGAFSSSARNNQGYCYGTEGTWNVQEGGYDNVSLNVSHTHSVTAKGTVSSSFRGYAGTTGSNGSGTSFSILPPYVVKYCWERTA